MNIKGLLSSAYSKTLNVGQTVYAALPGKSSAAKLGQSILTTCKAHPIKLTGLVTLLGAGTTVAVFNKNRIGSPMPFLKETWGKTTSKVSDLYKSYTTPKAQEEAESPHKAKYENLQESLRELVDLAKMTKIGAEEQRKIIAEVEALIDSEVEAPTIERRRSI